MLIPIPGIERPYSPNAFLRERDPHGRRTKEHIPCVGEDMCMATETTRDRIWSMALAKAAHDKPVDPIDVADQVECTERTARDCLNAAARTPFLRRTTRTDGTVLYTPTARARGK